VNKVVRTRSAKVAADRTRGSLEPERLTHQRSRNFDASIALQNKHNHRPRCNVVDQARIKRLALVRCVMPLCKIARNLHELHRAERKAFLLESLKHLSDEASLNRIRFENNQCSVHRFCCFPACCSCRYESSPASTNRPPSQPRSSYRGGRVVPHPARNDNRRRHTTRIKQSERRAQATRVLKQRYTHAYKKRPASDKSLTGLLWSLRDEIGSRYGFASTDSWPSGDPFRSAAASVGYRSATSFTRRNSRAVSTCGSAPLGLPFSSG